jgi:hypothetical protein
MDSSVEIEKDFEKIRMTLYENGIMSVLFKENFTVGLKDVEEVVAWVSEIANGRKFLNLMEGESNSEVDAEVRSFSASKEQNKFTIADAMVVKSISHRLLSNFYLKFNKPVMPTRLFTDKEKAIQWLLSQKES